MKSAILFSVLCLFTSFSPGKEGLPVLVLNKSAKDSSLQLNESLFKFTFQNLIDQNEAQEIQYSMDGVEGKVNLTNKKFIEFKTTPGKHVFQFYYNKEFYEVETDTLLIRPGYKDEYSIYLQNAVQHRTVKKPVIYLYPEAEIDIEVKLDIKGDASFMYPAYNDSWKFKAQPDGTLLFGNKSYNYLFWEADQAIALTPNEIETGFVFESTNAVEFLEEKLTLAGLTSKEKADFITFWGPQMAKYEGIYLRFEFNESCDKYAELNISPEPDNIYRIYIIWSPVNAFFEVKEQEIIPINRKGFTVLEWGGREEKITIPKHLIH